MHASQVDSAELRALGAALRAQGHRIVFTNGCFDLLHVGHVRFLREARSLGDVLVVGVNTDASVRRLKGAGRPLVPQAERVEVLGALESVDYVVLLADPTPFALIDALRPDFACKGGDYQGVVLGEATAVRSYGGEFRTLAHIPGRSTSALLADILERSQQPVAS